MKGQEEDVAVAGEARDWRAKASLRRAAFFVFVVLVVRYGCWRVLRTIPSWRTPVDLAVWIFYSSLEAVYLSTAWRMLSLLRDRVVRRSETPPLGDWWTVTGREPEIAIFIPTYNEPEVVLERTIIAARRQSYGNYSVWLLDDGARADIRLLAERLGAHYLARADRSGAKAGNLNHGLAHLRAIGARPEYVAVLDSDFVAQPEFLAKVLRLIKTEGVGLVQTPQYFYNADPVQAAFPHGNPLPDDLRFAHDVIHAALDARGLAWCRGTSFLVRADALESIGGFPTDTVVEDYVTSQRLRERGWRTINLGESLAFGLAPESFGEYLRQRRRWSLGYGQVARAQWSEARGALKRLRALEGPLRWVYTATIQTLLIFGVPALYWYVGISPFRASSRELIAFGLPIVLFFRAYMMWFTVGKNLPIFREAAQLTAFPTLLEGALVGLTGWGKQGFAVTGKGLRWERRIVYVRSLLWLGGVFLVSACGPLWRWWRGTPPGPADAAMALWSCYASLVAAMAMFVAVERPNRRADVRFGGRGEAVLVSPRSNGDLSNGAHRADAGGRIAGTLVDISCHGARIALGEPAFPFERARIDLDGLGPMDVEVIRWEGSSRFAVAFAADSELRQRLVPVVFSRRFIAPVTEGRFLGAVGAAARRLAGGLLFGRAG
jgi:cellulose synthase (UDP-forming)